VSYCTADDLFDALRVTAANQRVQLRSLAEQSVAAAAVEIDHSCGRAVDTPLPTDPPDPLAHMVNIARGIEWFKANDAAFGALGFANIGVLAVPAEGFARHAAALTPLVQSFGLA
jgi:hypothetical protein